MYCWDDPMDDIPATPADAMREYAWNVGRERRDLEWISTPYDTWEKNPFFEGTPGPHPEDWNKIDEYTEMVDRFRNWMNEPEPVAGYHNGFDDFDTKVQVEEMDDDLPF
jgi:hypothetical protein